MTYEIALEFRKPIYIWIYFNDLVPFYYINESLYGKPEMSQRAMDT